MFYSDIEEIKSNNKDQEKDFKIRKAVINSACKLYDKLLNIYIQLNMIILQKIRRKK